MAATILLVEDNPSLCALMERHLEAQGYGTATAATGREASAWLAAHSADLLLLDFHLPDMTGQDLVDALDECDLLCPFIVITGFGDERLAVTMMKKGALDYLMKDSSLLDLLPLVVHQTLEKLDQKNRLAAAQRDLLRFRKVMDKAGEAIFIADADSGCLLDANETAGAYTGHPRNSLLQKHLAALCILPSLTAPEQWPAYVEGLKDAPGQRATYQHSFCPGVGPAIPVELTAYLERVEDQECVLMVMRDVTDRQKAAEQQIQLERLLALQQLSGGVSHNLNNMLVGVLCPAELLKERLSEPTDIQYIDFLLASTQRAIDTVQRLAETVSGQAEEARATVVAQAVWKALDASRATWPQDRPICLVVDLHPLPSCHATPTGLHAILLTLIENAVEAMPDGGTLTLKARHRQGSVSIAVTDTGIGMDEASRRYLFEPFHTDKPAVGAGLGLASAYGMVIHWGGAMHVASTPGTGTTMTVALATTDAPRRLRFKAAYPALPPPSHALPHPQL